MIHWGIIGLGNIAKRFAESLKNSDVGMLYGGASHNESKRNYFKDKYGIKTYGQYLDLLNDDNIDVVYIALPHGLHYQWIKEALLRNKAVLCEKPITLNQDELKELVDLSKEKHTFLMEGMKSRFIPMTKQIQKLVDDGVIGDIERIETSFCNDVPYMENHYLYDENQGGILFDCGIYNIATILQFIKSDVKEIKVEYTKKYNVDVDDKIEIIFESGQVGYMENSMIENREKKMRIIGTKGIISATPFYRPQEAVVEFYNGESFTGYLPYDKDDFYSEIEEVHRCLGFIEIESPLMSHDDSLRCNELMLKIKEKLL